MSDTPRTDSQIGSLANASDDTCCWLEIGLPRTLERELAEKDRKIAALQVAVNLALDALERGRK